MLIKIDDLNSVEIHTLLQQHLDDMAAHSPPESIHALNPDELRRPDITFWTAWDENSLMGCGAIKELNPTHGEIKSMRTSTHHLRKGVAAKLLVHILSEAKKCGYQRLSLETGSMAAFHPAQALYRKFGFTECKPFADYKPDPNSLFLTRQL